MVPWGFWSQGGSRHRPQAVQFPQCDVLGLCSGPDGTSVSTLCSWGTSCPPGSVATSWFLTHFLFFNSFLAFLHGNGAEKAERKKLVAGTGYGDSARFGEDLGSESFWGFHLCMGNVPGSSPISKPWGCSSEPWLQLPWAA